MTIGNHPAFPCEAQGNRSVPQEHDYIQTGIYSGKFPGLMIRDWLAGQALRSLGIWTPCGPSELIDVSSPLAHQRRAEWSYNAADAMLAERDKAAATQQEQTS